MTKTIFAAVTAALLASSAAYAADVYQAEPQPAYVDAPEVAVACPFCRIMVGDGMTARQSDVEVLDVAQVLLRSVKAEQ